jgi:hypothetical protein
MNHGGFVPAKFAGTNSSHFMWVVCAADIASIPAHYQPTGIGKTNDEQA